MRPLILLLGLLGLCGSVQAQPVEEAFLALTASASASVQDEEDEGGFCSTFFDPVPPEEEGICAGLTNGQLACLVGVSVVGAAGVVAVLYGAYGDDFCASACISDEGPPASREVIVTRFEEEGARPLVLEVVRSQPRGLGAGPVQAPITVRALDAETRQPVALGPLGSPTATVRTAADLRSLLNDR